MKKLLSVLLAILCMMSLTTVSFAVSYDGTCGENLKWQLDTETGTLTISGEGDMEDYTYENNSPWDETLIKKVVIENGVTSIGDRAFNACEYLATVTIPDSVVEIGTASFSSCNNLTDLTMPESVEIIGDSAFSDCNEFVNFIIGNGVKSIGDSAFSYCDNLISVTIGNSVTTIGESAFNSCDKLETVVMPLSITNIGRYAFSNSRNIEKVLYPGTQAQWELVTVGEENFYLEKNLIFECNSENPYYGKGACGDNLEWVLYDSGDFIITGTGDMYEYGYFSTPWYYYDDKITTVTLPDGLTSICDNAFRSFSVVKSITIPDTVTRIGSGAFSFWYDLTSVSIPDSVEIIEDESFAYCDQLKSVDIGSGVTCFGDEESPSINVFEACASLETITVDPDNKAYFTDAQGVLFDVEKTMIVAFPFGKGITDFIIPASVVAMNTEDLVYATELKTLFVEPGNTMFSSDEHGILYNKDKTELLHYPVLNETEEYMLPETVTYFNPYTFVSRNNLVNLVIPSLDMEESYLILYFCKNLKTVSVGTPIDKYSYSFGGCPNLEKITVSEDDPNFSTDENGILYNKDKTELIFVPAKSFEDSFVIPETVKNVDYTAFIDHSDFSITLPDSLEDYSFIENLSVNEFIVSSNNPILKVVDGALCIYDEESEGLALFKYPISSDRDVFIVPDTVSMVSPNAFRSPASGMYMNRITAMIDDPTEINLYNCPESLTVHAPYTTEIMFCYGPEHIYVSGEEFEGMLAEEYIELVNEYWDTYEEEVWKELEKKSVEYTEAEQLMMTAIYRGEVDSIPEFSLCDGDHTQIHSYTSSVTTEPTCTTEGVMTYTCVCGDTYTEVIPVKDHETVPFEQKSTCSVAGYRCDLCTACGGNFNTEELELLSHSWGEWVVETEPTTEQEGVEKRVCSECGETETKSIPTIEETEEPTIWDKIAAFFENVADFFNNIFEWFANLFKV